MLFQLYIGFLILLTVMFTLIGLRAYKDRYVKKVSRLKTLVVLPCRGKELTFAENLESFKNQSYKSYKIIAVVDSEQDAAVPELKRHGIDYIKASSRPHIGSGKVNAIATALEKLRNYDAYVVADADMTVTKDWLAYLLSPLEDKQIGISTTFPIFKPIGGFWSSVKCVWSLVGQGMMESNALRFGWGGSLAFRRSLMEGKLDYFRKFIADDVAITMIAKEKGLHIAYVKRVQPIVNCNDNMNEFIEWANRQTAHSINGYRWNFWAGVTLYSATILLFISGIVLTLTSAVYIVFLLPYVINMIKGYRRLNGTKCKNFILINTAMPAILLGSLLRANSMKEISWRGRKYKLEYADKISN